MRNKKPAIILITLFVASFSILTLLAFLAKNTYEKKNGFTRKLYPVTLQSKKQVTFPIPITNIIGTNAGKLYFQGNSAYEVYSTNVLLDSLEIIKLSIPYDKKLQRGVRMFLNGRLLYLLCRHIPGIITYDLDSNSSYNHVLTTFYSKEANISKNQFILRTKDLHSSDPVFIKLDLKNKNARWEDHFSEKQGRGGIPTDGILYYDSTTHLACYTYFYQNGFICMDTNLNLKLKARTIDTITKREVQIAHVGSSYSRKQPPQFVNLTGEVANGKLYLQSMLKADNEYSLDFSENSTIDVYNLTNGDYKGSFYIPAYKGEKTPQFKIIGTNLYAIYGKTVIMYDLDFIDP